MSLALSVACASGDDISTLERPAPAAGSEPGHVALSPATPGGGDAEGALLQLERLTPAELAGSYTAAEVQIGFSSHKDATGLRWALTRGDGSELYSMERTGDVTVISVLGEYRQYIEAAPLAELNEMDPSTLDEATASALVPSEGDPTKVYDLQATPEFAQLPELSRLLGERGVTGSEYPAALPLHMFAMAAARSVKPPPPASSEPADEQAPGLELQGFQQPGLACSSSGGQTCCLNPSTGLRSCFPTPPPPPPPPPCMPAYSGDLRCDPNGDECFGMCGDGCDCWTWVCGDCRWHWGCHQHDWVCQQVENASWTDWVLFPAVYGTLAAQCYGGLSALIALEGC